MALATVLAESLQLNRLLMMWKIHQAKQNEEKEPLARTWILRRYEASPSPLAIPGTDKKIETFEKRN